MDGNPELQRAISEITSDFLARALAAGVTLPLILTLSTPDGETVVTKRLNGDMTLDTLPSQRSSGMSETPLKMRAADGVGHVFERDLKFGFVGEANA